MLVVFFNVRANNKLGAIKGGKQRARKRKKIYSYDQQAARQESLPLG